jgi:transcriptional regulator with XRE-family HTH domain
MNGSRLLQARERAGLSQDGLGKLTGMSQQMIGAIERGARTCSLKHAEALARALGVSQAWLLGLETELSPTKPDPGLLSDYQTPEGLVKLQQDLALRRALGITTRELQELSTLRLADPPDKSGWVALLNTLRAVRPRRRDGNVT